MIAAQLRDDRRSVGTTDEVTAKMLMHAAAGVSVPAPARCDMIIPVTAPSMG
jgi:hypothetical protein